MKDVHLVLSLWNAEAAGSDFDFAYVILTEAFAKELEQRRKVFFTEMERDSTVLSTRYLGNTEPVFLVRRPELETGDSLLPEMFDKLDESRWLEIAADTLPKEFLEEDDEVNVIQDHFLVIGKEGFSWDGITDDGEVNTEVLPWSTIKKFL